MIKTMLTSVAVAAVGAATAVAGTAERDLEQRLIEEGQRVHARETPVDLRAYYAARLTARQEAEGLKTRAIEAHRTTSAPTGPAVDLDAAWVIGDLFAAAPVPAGDPDAAWAEAAAEGALEAEIVVGWSDMDAAWTMGDLFDAPQIAGRDDMDAAWSGAEAALAAAPAPRAIETASVAVDALAEAAIGPVAPLHGPTPPRGGDALLADVAPGVRAEFIETGSIAAAPALDDPFLDLMFMDDTQASQDWFDIETQAISIDAVAPAPTTNPHP